MITQLEKRLSETAVSLLEDSALQMNILAGMLEVLARRMPGLTPAEQSLFAERSCFLLGVVETRQADTKRLKAELPKLQTPEFPLS